MTLGNALRLAGLMEPGHLVEPELLVEFLNELEGLIQVEILLIAPEEVVSYTLEDSDKELLLRAPHDRIYVHYLAGMIRMVNREFDDYNNQQAVVDEKLRGFKRWFLQTYRPADTHDRSYVNHTPGTVGTPWRGYYLTAYGIALKHGFTGTEAEWLASLKGDKGDKGEPALMRYDEESGYIQWQVRNADSWENLILVADIVEAAVADATERAENAALRAEKAAAKIDAAASRDYVDEQVEELWAEIRYEPIEITSIRHSAGTVELGTVLDSVDVSWGLNKDPARQVLYGTLIDPADRSAAVVGPFEDTAEISLIVTDEREATDSAKTTVSFFNGIYYGALPTSTALDSSVILGLTRKLQGSRGATFNVTCDGNRPVYACPSRYGTPVFRIGGFEYTWNHLATIDFVNSSGYEERYDVWMHGQDVSGSVTVAVA